MTSNYSPPRGPSTAAGLLLLDADTRILLVKPTYKPGWEIPGGQVEENEAPLAAARREASEELGLDIEPGRLLSLDYRHAQPPGTVDALRFVFDGGTLSASETARIRLPADELREWRFFPPAEAQRVVSSGLGPVLSGCLEVLGTERTTYLEQRPGG